MKARQAVQLLVVVLTYKALQSTAAGGQVTTGFYDPSVTGTWW